MDLSGLTGYIPQTPHIVEAVKVPVLANLTEFGQTPLFSREQLASVGVAMQLFPLSAFRAANKAAEAVYAARGISAMCSIPCRPARNCMNASGITHLNSNSTPSRPANKPLLTNMALQYIHRWHPHHQPGTEKAGLLIATIQIIQCDLQHRAQAHFQRTFIQIELRRVVDCRIAYLVMCSRADCKVH